MYCIGGCHRSLFHAAFNALALWKVRASERLEMPIGLYLSLITIVALPDFLAIRICCIYRRSCVAGLICKCIPDFELEIVQCADW